MKMGIKLMVINFMILCSFLFVIAKREKPWERLKFPPLSKISEPKIDIFQLENGLKVFFLKDPQLPEVKIVTYVKAGELASPDDKFGVATITYNLLRNGGNKKYSSDKFDEIIDSLGASISVDVGRDKAEIQGIFLSEDFEKGIELFSCMLREPVFEEEKIEVEKNKIRGSIARRNDDPSVIATREFKKLVYGKNKLTREIEYEDLDKIKREDLVNFYNAYISPDNIYIGVYGDFSEKDAKAYIEKFFGNWKKVGMKEEIPFLSDSGEKGIYVVNKSDVNQSNIRLGHIGILRKNPDYTAVLVLDNILGTNSFSSRLMQKIRTEKGLAYSVGGGIFSDFEYPGVFMIYCGTKTESTLDAISSIMEEIEKIKREEVSEKELEDAKNSFLNSFVFEFANGFDYLKREMELYMWGYPLDFYSKIFDGIKKVTVLDVKKAAQKYLHPEKLKILVVGEGDKLKKTLSKLGEVNEVDISIPLPERKLVGPDELRIKRGKSILTEIFMNLGFSGKKISGYREVVMGKIYQNGTVEIPGVEMESFMIFPDKLYINMKLPMGIIKTVFKGNYGYREIMGKKVDFSKKELEQLRSVFERDLLFISTLVPERDFVVWDTGKREFFGKKLNSIRILFKDKNFLDIFYSLNEGEKIVEGFSYVDISDGNKTLVEKKIEGFKNFSGIKVPESTIMYKNGVKFGEFKTVKFQLDPTKLPVEIR